MANKELRSLSKLELLEILHRQELEIERLKSEKDDHIPIERAGSIAEASLMVSGVMKAAQDAADMYLESVKTVEAEKNSIAEHRHEEILELNRQILTAMQKLFDSHLGRLISARTELQDMIKKSGITELLKTDGMGDGKL